MKNIKLIVARAKAGWPKETVRQALLKKGQSRRITIPNKTFVLRKGDK